MARLIAMIVTLCCSLLLSCGANDMPLPPDHQYVSAADAGPGAPFTQIECPDDKATAAAADIRRVCAALLANEGYRRVRRAQWTYDDEGPPFTFNIFSEDFYESPLFGGYIEFPETAVGDTIQAWLLCDAQNGQTSTGNGNRLRLAAIDDYGGPDETSAVAVPGARTYVNAPDEQMTSVAIAGEWIVTVAGATRIYMQGRVNSEPGELRIQSRVFMTGEHRSAATESITP